MGYTPNIWYLINHYHFYDSLRLAEVMGSGLWARSHFYPQIAYNITAPWNVAPGNDAQASTAAGSALAAVTWIKWWAQQFSTNFPSRTFKYSFSPQGFGHKFDYNSVVDNSLLSHIDDRMSGNVVGPYLTNGLAYHKAFAETYFGTLKNALDSEGLPYPTRIDFDLEYFGNDSGNTFNPDYDDNAADPRFNTVKIDGKKTYKQLAESAIGRDGSPISTANLGNQAFGQFNTRCWETSINYRIRENALYQTAIKALRQYWPSMRMTNWDHFCSTRDFPTHSARFREAPVDNRTIVFTEDRKSVV
jgi:hypothetical protein